MITYTGRTSTQYELGAVLLFICEISMLWFACGVLIVNRTRSRADLAKIYPNIHRFLHIMKLEIEKLNHTVKKRKDPS